MIEELDTIDGACVTALKRLKGEQDTLNSRIKAMDEMKATVAEAVYLRVRSDYVAKRNALLDQAKPLLEQARTEYQRLVRLVQRSEAELESSRLDQQEIEFRHQLGEFDDAAYREQAHTVAAALQEKTAAYERATTLREQFLSAVQSEQELLPTAPTGSAPPLAASDEKPLDGAITDRLPPVDVPVGTAHSQGPLGSTHVLPVVGQDAGHGRKPVSMETTVVFKPARLVPQNPEAGRTTHALALKAIQLGSDASNEIRITGPGIEGKHAQITPTPEGFLITDQNTKQGVRVNAERVKEKLLKHEDVVQVGAARFIFRST